MWDTRTTEYNLASFDFFLVKWKNLGYERQEGLPSEINMTVFF